MLQEFGEVFCGDGAYLFLVVGWRFGPCDFTECRSIRKDANPISRVRLCHRNEGNMTLGPRSRNADEAVDNKHLALVPGTFRHLE